MSESADNTKLWRTFGRNTPAGRALYSLYNTKESLPISYPRLSTRAQSLHIPPPPKPCPQRAHVAVPKPAKKSASLDANSRFNGCRRKPLNVISQEAQNHIPVAPPTRPRVDREEMKIQLAEQFQFSKSSLSRVGSKLIRSNDT
eukprot:GHVL01024449.1.p1 GENE.GHVL01024449.1~~GHVL01024449.1.p1  ORF type:complete len:144 (+),score=14.42 GHVL01024449.1:461-892(+)